MIGTGEQEMKKKPRKPRAYETDNGYVSAYFWPESLDDDSVQVQGIDMIDPKKIRRLADWLNRAASWLEYREGNDG